MDNQEIDNRSYEEISKDDAATRLARMQEAAALAKKMSQESQKLIKTIKIQSYLDADLGELIEKEIINNWMYGFRNKNGLQAAGVKIYPKGPVVFCSGEPLRAHYMSTGVLLSYFMPGSVKGEVKFFFTDERGIVLTDEQFLECMQKSYKKYSYERQVGMEIELKEWNFLLTGQEDSVAKEGKSVEQKKGELWYKLLDLPHEVGGKLILKGGPDWHLGKTHYLEVASDIKVIDSRSPFMDMPQIMVGTMNNKGSNEGKIEFSFLTMPTLGSLVFLHRHEVRSIISDSYAEWQNMTITAPQREEVKTVPQLDQLQSAESVMDKANSPLK